MWSCPKTIIFYIFVNRSGLPTFAVTGIETAVDVIRVDFLGKQEIMEMYYSCMLDWLILERKLIEESLIQFYSWSLSRITQITWTGLCYGRRTLTKGMASDAFTWWTTSPSTSRPASVPGRSCYRDGTLQTSSTGSSSAGVSLLIYSTHFTSIAANGVILAAARVSLNSTCAILEFWIYILLHIIATSKNIVAGGRNW